MMDWMAQFKMPKGASSDVEMEFLNAQMISVNAMKNQMLTAIENGEKLAAKY